VTGTVVGDSGVSFSAISRGNPKPAEMTGESLIAG